MLVVDKSGFLRFKKMRASVCVQRAMGYSSLTRNTVDFRQDKITNERENWLATENWRIQPMQHESRIAFFCHVDFHRSFQTNIDPLC